MNCLPPKIASVIKNFPIEISDNRYCLYCGAGPTGKGKKSIITSGYYIVIANVKGPT